MGVIKNIAKFFALLPPPCRLSYLPLLHDLLHSASPFNWRIRQSLAGQLPELLLLPKRENVCETLFPLIMALFQDPVASVRHATFKGIAELINMLHTMATSPANEIGGSVPSTDSDEMNLSSSEYAQQCLLYVIDNLNIFMKDAIYMKRLFWVELVQTLLKTIPRDVCEQHFVPGIVLLTSDPVCNIRVSISVLLTNWAPEFNPPWMETESTTENPFAWLLARKDIRLCVERLRVDDKDVYRNVSKLQPIFPELEFGFCSCRGLKAAPGGSVPVQVLSLDICEDGAIADEVASRDSLLSVEASTESAAAVVAQTPTAKSSSKPRSHSVDLTQSGHRLFRTATEHFVLGSPIDASSATAYLNLSNKPKEEGLEDRPFWASVDEVAVGEDTVHIPVEAEPVILGTRMTKNFPFDDDEDDLANPQNVLPARENAAVLPDSTDEPVETPETTSTIKVDE